MSFSLNKFLKQRLFAQHGIINTYINDEQLALLLNQDNYIKEIEDVIPDNSEQFPISQALARFLARIVINMEFKNILEFGAGSSSLVFARSLKLLGGGRLTSVESDPQWCSDIWEKVEGINVVDAELIVSTPRFVISRKGLYHSYTSAKKEIAKRGPYDLVLIDAPQWSYGRDGSLHTAFPFLRKGTLLVIDDAGRPGDRWSLYRWLQIYPGLQLALYDQDFAGKGVALLYYDGDKRNYLSCRCIITSAYHSMLNWLTRRRRT